MAFRNIVMNGAMQIDQRNSGAPLDASNGTFILDRWHFSGIDPDTFEAGQNLMQTELPEGFEYCLGIKVKQSRCLSNGDWFNVVQIIEADRIHHTGFGTSAAQALTLSFWARSSIAGLHSGGLANSTSTRSFPFAFTLTKADTWEQQTISIPGDSAGSWTTEGRGKGMALVFNLASMPPNTAAAGRWIDGNHICAEGSVSVAGTSGASFYLTGVQLEIGAVATPYEFIPVTEELMQCQRYYEALGGSSERAEFGRGFSAGNSSILAHVQFRTAKRCAPTIYLEGNNFSFQTKAGALPVSALSAIGSGASALFLSGESVGVEAGLDGILQTAGTSRISLSSEL